MGKRKDPVATSQVTSGSVEIAEDFTAGLIRDLNKSFGTRIAFNLSEDEAPTTIKRWISTGSTLLDYVISNRRHGGIPEGRVIEIAGPPSIGKSHIAFQTAKVVQKMGGLVVYIDTENATAPDKLAQMGINVSKRFVYCDTHCTEEVFSIMESTILKAKNIVNKDIPILVVWDSVAATSPKQELEGNYDDQTMGLQARVISKGMRKITGVIGQNNVTLICVNQLRSKVGFVMGDPNFTPGGIAIPYHASVRIRLGSGAHIKDKDGIVCGIHVTASTVKNKVAQPFRKIDFDIHFGRGIVEGEQLLDVVRSHCADNGPMLKDGKYVLVEGTSTWKTLTVADEKTKATILEKKFTKNQFSELLEDPTYAGHLYDLIEAAMVIDTSKAVELASEDEEKK